MKVVVLLLCLVVLALSYGNLINVALNKPALQIDTYKYEVGGAAERANEGNDDIEYSNNHCSHTKNKKNTWWMVDLLGDFTVVAANITNRDIFSYRLRDFTVYLSRENPLNSLSFPRIISGQKCFYREREISSGKMELIHCTNPTTGRYLNVFKPDHGVLTICEIQVLASDVADLGYRMIQGKMILTSPFSSLHDISSVTTCIFQCRREPNGSATSIQYRKVGVCAIASNSVDSRFQFQNG